MLARIRARASDLDLDLDQIDKSINLLKAKPENFGPAHLAWASDLIEGYLSTPHLCKFKPQGKPPLEEVAHFLACGSMQDLKQVLYDLRTEQREASSYGWFVTVAANRLLKIPARGLKAVRAELHAFAGGKQKSRAATAGSEPGDFQSEIQRKLKSVKRVS
ncbi:MAG: hypothetical protein ABSG29_09690 [Steroidobacteraceae bacterium]|jgi:hypothetical protein